MRQVELLAPAGSMECLRAAIENGADAVYMGGPRFGARAYAKNPESEGLVEAIDYVHRHGKKIYLTVNTLLKEEELEDLPSYLLPFYEAGLDAVLVQDLGVMQKIREYFPDLPVHASTQMTVMDPDGARRLMELGLTRVVTAREVTIPEMRAIADTGIEVEVFVHGAICYCYSGQCLMSSLIGGRSGNRGRCAQPCRLPYDVFEGGKVLTGKDKKHVLNLKDMDTLDVLPQIVEAGVVSLKIEGRMKSPRYTAGVTAVYRKYLDMCLSGGRYQVDPADRRYLKELFDRGGYTEYASHGLKDRMVAIEGKAEFRAVEETFLSEHEKTLLSLPKKQKIRGRLIFLTGEPVRLQIFHPLDPEGEQEPLISLEGETVQSAANRPMTEEDLRNRFSKLGDTEYVWESLSIVTDGKGFLPVGQCNELRRAGIRSFEKTLLSGYRRQAPENPKKGEKAGKAEERKEEGIRREKPLLRVSVDTVSQLRRALSVREIDRIYLNGAVMTEKEEETAFALMEEAKKDPSLRMDFYLSLPPVLRGHMKEKLRKKFFFYEKSSLTGFLVHTWDQAVWLLKEMPGKKIQADASVYTFNGGAEEVLAREGVDGVTLPVELNSKELLLRSQTMDLPKELIAYGYLPVMVSAQCVHRTVKGCNGKPELLVLKDRMRKEFFVRNCCRYCFNVIYNSAPLYLLDLRKEWAGLKTDALRLQFTMESETEMGRILDAALWTLEGKDVPSPVKEITRGHWKRGVE